LVVLVSRGLRLPLRPRRSLGAVGRDVARGGRSFDLPEAPAVDRSTAHRVAGCGARAFELLPVELEDEVALAVSADFTDVVHLFVASLKASAFHYEIPVIDWHSRPPPLLVAVLLTPGAAGVNTFV